jgi:hypothetical protein
MKKLVFTLVVTGIFTTLFGTEWVCYRYLNGKPTGGTIKVYANSEKEAERKGVKKYKEMGYSVDFVKCKVELF